MRDVERARQHVGGQPAPPQARGVETQNEAVQGGLKVVSKSEV